MSWVNFHQFIRLLLSSVSMRNNKHIHYYFLCMPSAQLACKVINHKLANVQKQSHFARS